MHLIPALRFAVNVSPPLVFRVGMHQFFRYQDVKSYK
jgi:hypothetical protein